MGEVIVEPSKVTSVNSRAEELFVQLSDCPQNEDVVPAEKVAALEQETTLVVAESKQYVSDLIGEELQALGEWPCDTGLRNRPRQERVYRQETGRLACG